MVNFPAKYDGLLAGMSFGILGVLFLFVFPFWLVAVSAGVVGIIGIIYLYKHEQYRSTFLVTLALVLFFIAGIVSSSFLSVSQGLIITDIMKGVAFGVVVSYYARFVPVFVVIVLFYSLAFGLAVATRVKSFFRAIEILSYILIMVVILCTVLSFLAPQGYETFVTVFGLAMPFELFYSLEIGSWIISAFMFVSNFLSKAFIKS